MGSLKIYRMLIIFWQQKVLHNIVSDKCETLQSTKFFVPSFIDHRHLSMKVPNVEFNFDVWLSTLMH